MVKRLPQHGQRVGKKITDLLSDLDRAEEELKSQGYNDESNRVKAIKAIRITFDTDAIKGHITLLKDFPKVED